MRDITLGETVDFKFSTHEPDTGAPITLAGSPVISAYVGNSTTEITAGITLTVDFDGRTGFHNVRVVASSGNGFTDASDVALVITTGTVDGVSAVGYIVKEFTIGRSAAHTRLGAPAGASVSADIAAIEAQTEDIGAAGAGLTAVPWNPAWDAEVQSEVTDALTDATAGAVPWQGVIDQGTAQSATSTTLVLRAAAAFADDNIIGATILITGGSAGVGQSRSITDYDSATDTATVAAWTTTPTGTITYKIFATAPAAGGLDAAGVRVAVGLASANLDTQLSGIQSDTNDIQARLPAALVSGRIDASVGAMAANVMTAAAAAADLTTELQTGLATAANLATLQTSVDDVPTNAELATALGTADDAVLAQVALVKAKTDQLTFGATNTVNANITHVIADPVQESGSTSTNWGGAP